MASDKIATMKNNRAKTKVADIVDEIIELRKRIKDDTERLQKLQSIRLPDAQSKPEPENFDYKDAIIGLFEQRPDLAETIDGVVDYIRVKYGFEPNRETTSLRIGYLVDTANKLERVKRGYYRLASKIETPANGS